MQPLTSHLPTGAQRASSPCPRAASTSTCLKRLTWSSSTPSLSRATPQLGRIGCVASLQVRRLCCRIWTPPIPQSFPFGPSGIDVLVDCFVYQLPAVCDALEAGWPAGPYDEKNVQLNLHFIHPYADLARRYDVAHINMFRLITDRLLTEETREKKWHRATPWQVLARLFEDGHHISRAGSKACCQGRPIVGAIGDFLLADIFVNWLAKVRRGRFDGHSD